MHCMFGLHYTPRNTNKLRGLIALLATKVCLAVHYNTFVVNITETNTNSKLYNSNNNSNSSSFAKSGAYVSLVGCVRIATAARFNATDRN